MYRICSLASATCELFTRAIQLSELQKTSVPVLEQGKCVPYQRWVHYSDEKDDPEDQAKARESDEDCKLQLYITFAAPQKKTPYALQVF